MCPIKVSIKYFKLLIYLNYFINAILFIYGAGIDNKYDTLSFERARAIFSRPKSKYGNINKFEIWNLVDREIALLKKNKMLPAIYLSAGGREMFASVEIMKACERLLSRIEMDSYTPVIIDDDSTIFGIEIENNNIQFCNRVSREIQYCLLQYGPDVLEIPALANYFAHIKKCGVDKVFVDPEAKEILNDLAKSTVQESSSPHSDADMSFLLLSGADDHTKYLVSDPRRVEVVKRKLVTIQPKKTKLAKEQGKKTKIDIKQEQKRIIARPKRVTRQSIYDKVSGANLPVSTAGVITKQLASKRSAGVNILELIKQGNLSEKFDSIGYEAQLILAWQSVVEAQTQFNEDSDYEVKDLPSSISTSVLYQASPNFSLSNFQNSCLEIILFRNSQIEKGLIDGKQTLFYLKDGETVITSKHILKTAAMQLCKIAQEYYLPDIIKNSDKYIDRLRRMEVKDIVESDVKDEQYKEDSRPEISKQKLIKERLIDSYKKSLTKRGLVPLLANEDNVWAELENCNTGECVNDIVYENLSHWFVPVGSIISAIFRISSEHYSDSLVIFDFTQPITTKVGNIFDNSSETVFDLCLKYLETLSDKGKLSLVIGGIYSDISYLFRELCKEVSIELSKNESFLTNKQSLIGTLYELELLFCGVLGVQPKGPLANTSEYKTELEMLSSGAVYSGRDIWALEECTLLLPEQLNYLLCLGAFANGFISHLFPGSKESVIPITLFCKAFLLIEKDMNDPYNPDKMGAYLTNVILENGVLDYLPFKQNPNVKEKKIMTKFFVELCNQFKKNHENHFYIDQSHIHDSILRVHSIRICSAPLFPFLPFEIKFYPIDKKLVSTLEPYGFNTNLKSIISNKEIQACLGVGYHIKNYLHVLAAIVEAFVNNYIDLKKIGTNRVIIPVNSLCLWWKHPVKYSFGDVLSNILPFMSRDIVAEYVLRYCLLMESVNFPAQITPEKRIEFIYSTPQISSNRAIDLPKNVIFPEFNPPNNVFLELKYYLRKDVIASFNKFEPEETEIIENKLTFEEVSSLCQYLDEWQVYLLISFQNTVTIILKTVLSKLYFNTAFEIPVVDLCNWVSTIFPKNFVGEASVTASDAGNALEDIVGGKVPWLQKSMGEYLMMTFIIWAQTAFLLKVGEVRTKKINRNTIDLPDIKKLFDKRITSLVETPENPKIIPMEQVHFVSRLRLNPFVDSTVGLVDPELESSCDGLWVVNLMIAFRVYFLAFQKKFIEPIFHGEFDPFVICDIVKEIVKNKVFQNGFGDSFFRAFKEQKWVSNKQLVRILVKNATTWIQETFDLPGIPTYDASQYKDENLLECYKLSFTMENRPIASSITFSIDEIHPEVLPEFKITDFPTLSLKSIEQFLITRDPVKFYNIDDCIGLSDSEIRMLVSLSSFLETTSKGLFISRVPTLSPKRGLLEELQFEFPISLICKWWSFVKSTNTSPNYALDRNCWSSVLQKKVSEHYSEIIKTDPEMNFPWKEWFTVPVAESLLYSFFKSVLRNTENDISTTEIIAEHGFFDQSHIRNIAVIEDLFKTSSSYRYTTPFHRSLIDIKNLPLNYFDYLHLPAEDYNYISHFLKTEHKRPLNYSEIMVGRVLHQSEINKCVHMAFVTNKLSNLAINNMWKINVSHLFESYKNYVSSDLSFSTWIQNFRLSISNSALSVREAFIIYLKFLMEEARLINIEENDNNIRETADRQIEEYYSNSINIKSSFTPNPTKSHFPLFQINDNNEFSDLRMEKKNLTPPPMLKFNRFMGRYLRTKFALSATTEGRGIEKVKLIPQVWPSIGKIEIPEENNFRIISEAKVYSKYNCNGLSVWQINRAAYWAGMLQRYIHKGSRLLKDDHLMISKVAKQWNVSLKPKKFPAMKNVDVYNRSFNIFDMFFFYKVINYFYNEIEDTQSGINRKLDSWEEEHDKLPYYLIHLFRCLFSEHYINLTYLHIVIFFNELLLEEKRLIKLKIGHDSVYKTDIEQLMVVYHAPLFSEPDEFVYPGIFFELRSPLPVSWDKAVKFESIVIPIISTRSNNVNSSENMYYINGQAKSEIPLREIGRMKKEYAGVISGKFLQNLQIDYNSPFEKKIERIIQKSMPLSGKKWNSIKQTYESIRISENSMYWEHLSLTYTNGLDWFAKFSTLMSKSTVFTETSFLGSIIEEMAKLLPIESRDILLMQDPAILPTMFSNVNLFDLVFKTNENPVETLAEICKIYMSKTGPITYLISSVIKGENLSKTLNEECKKVVDLWEGVLPLLNVTIRKIFLMELIRRIKQADAELGSKLIWPTSSSLFTLEWSLFSKSASKNIKLNQSSGLYNFHFWDPALVLNTFITHAESSDLYARMNFTEAQILEISKTPAIELWSWISTFHSPIYSTDKIFNAELLRQLFISYINPIDLFNMNKAENTELEITRINTIFVHCIKWFNKAKILLEQMNSICKEIENKYGKTIILLYSKPHIFDFIYNSLTLLIEKHPVSDYSNHLNTEKVYRTRQTVYESIELAAYSYGFPDVIRVTALESDIKLKVYFDKRTMGVQYLQRVPAEMLDDLVKKKMFVFSDSFFLNNVVINYALTDSLKYLRLKTNKKMELKIEQDTSLDDLKSQCKSWISTYSNSISELDEKEVEQNSIQVVKSRSGKDGETVIDTTTNDGIQIRDAICTTFSELISLNHNIFSMKNKKLFNLRLKNLIAESQKVTLEDNILGWIGINKIVSLWSKDYSLKVSSNLFSNVILKLSVKNLTQMVQYSFNDFVRETGIKRLNFFFNYELILKTAIEVAYNIGFLMVIEDIPQSDIIPRNEGIEKLSSEETIKICISALDYLRKNSLLELIRANQKQNGEKINYQKLLIQICKGVYSAESKMFENFVESKSRRIEIIKDLHNRIGGIDKMETSTSFSFFETESVDA
ncbi:hypothetical protein RS030_203068 [Cryptosporidium xiaoi]|uniref:Uncharacterized protein n=1 Tax=Cryptosporidium xiaoi TaxID=659607 RepID=A0AAV9XXQ7_9CRYT